MQEGPPFYQRNFYGEDRSQRAARQAFPRLIELVTDSNCPTITYGKLANEISGFNARSMSYPLGSIWQTLYEYQQESGIEIPYLTTIVVNQTSLLPTIFKEHLNWSRERIKLEQDAVYKFKKWPDIERELVKRMG